MKIFWDYVVKIPFHECWEWVGPADKKGYGRIYTQNKTIAAHRLSYELVNGPIPRRINGRKAVIMHSCDNPRCVNPKHLSCGSQSDNILDAFRKGRVIPGGKTGWYYRNKLS